MTRIYRLLIINPGSTSTKMAIYENEEQIFLEMIKHSNKNLAQFSKIIDQISFRKDIILETLKREKIDLNKIDVIAARGGLLHSIPGGTYIINKQMLDDLKNARYGEHASNLGAIIADQIARQLNIPAYVVDPVVVDEMLPLYKVTGLPEIQRKSIFHALNQKAIARKAAKELGKNYDEVNFLVCHMGGGISVGAHNFGKVIDVNNSLNGEGPFSPERSGSLPIGDIVTLCYQENMTEDILKGKIVGKGGLIAHLGTNSLIEVEELITSGNEYAAFIYDAMVYQIAREIGKMSVTLMGKVDAIILTGGLANSKKLVNNITKYIEWIAPIKIYPGEDELFALAEGTLRILRGEEEVKTYQQEA